MLFLFAACEQNPLVDDPAARPPEQNPMQIGGPSQAPQAGPLSTQSPTLLPGSARALVRGDRPMVELPAASIPRSGALMHAAPGRDASPESFGASTGLLWENPVTGQRAIWEMDGPVFTGEAVVFAVAPPWRIAGAGDLDGNGHDDLVWQHPQSGDRYIWFMEGTTVLQSVFLGQVDPAWHIAAIGDMNADGRSDLVWQHVTSGDRYIWLMNGAQVIAAPYVGQIAPVWEIAGVGDFNSDGLGDLIWQNTATGDRYLWLMNVAQVVQAVPLIQIDPAWDIAGSGNFFSEAWSDILWQHRPTGWRSIWAMNGPFWSGSGAVLPVVDPQWNLVGAFGRRQQQPPPPPPGPVTGTWLYSSTVSGSVQGTPVTCQMQELAMRLDHDPTDVSVIAGFALGGTWNCGTGAEPIEGLLFIDGSFTAPNQASFAIGAAPLWTMNNNGTLSGNTLSGPARLRIPLGPATVVLEGTFTAQRLSIQSGALSSGAGASFRRPAAGTDVATSTRAVQQVLTRGIERAVAEARAREGLR